MTKRTVALLATALVAGSGFAATNYWDGTTGSWTNTARWSLGTVPGDTADYAFITNGTAQITPGAAPSGAIAQTRLGGASGANIEIGEDVEFKDIYMAEAGQTATISQTGGNVVFSGDLTTHIGRYGTATYNLSGGSLRHTSAAGADSHLFIGVYSGAVGTFNQTGGSFVKSGTSGQNIYVGFSGTATGTLNLSGGSFSQQDGSYVYLGYGADNSGVLNISGTAAFSATNAIVEVGQSGHGEINQTGGSVYARYIILGNASTGDGDYFISSGSVDVERYLYLHYGDSSMTVEGSGADYIKANRFLVGGKTMNINLDANGSTLIEVDGAAGSSYYNAYVNGTWNIDTLAGFNGTVGDTYDILWSAADILNTNTLNLVNAGATEFDWSIIDNVASDGTAGTGKMLRLTVIPEPATLGMVAFAAGAMLWIRRKFMI